MNTKKEVSIKKISQDAEDLFRGGFFCSEALISSVRSNFELDIPEEVIAMASGFPVGIGRSKCIFFGRTRQGDSNVEKNLELSKELHDWFKESNGKNSLCCRILTKEFDMSSGAHKEQCIHFTGMVAGKVAEIIVRELNLVNTDTLITI
ncbi:C-GCAxxG-C-C family protein [Clostridium tertium]|uniref:C-GCAxxG-C-C family protein n=1 Tax=Clostridium tertium TaxID=1559 RepID=UPI0024203DB9|nr:C-GCAxxG-C-C family protein [Clostridium tertium]